MREDTSCTEADAGAFAALAGRDEAFGDNPGDQSDDLLDVGDARLRADPWDELPPPCPTAPELLASLRSETAASQAARLADGLRRSER